MIRLAVEAVRVRLNAATALLEACQGRECPATILRRPYMFDTFKTLPADMIATAHELDRKTG